jgi:hypothetical protein
VIDKVEERITLMIEDAKTIKQLEKIGGEAALTPEQIELIEKKKESLKS